MQFRTSQRFPFTLAALWAACSRPDYVQRKYEALGDLAFSVRKFSATTRRIDVDVERRLALQQLALPVWVRQAGALPDVLRQHSSWQRAQRDGPVAVEMRVEVPHLPVVVEGTGTLVDVAGGSTQLAIDWEARFDLPLVRAPAERVLQALVRQALRRDRAFTVKYVRGHLARG